MKSLFYALFFIFVGATITTFVISNSKNSTINEKINTSCRIDNSKKCIYLVQKKIKEILLKHNIMANSNEVKIRSVFLNTLLEKKNISFLVKNSQATNNDLSIYTEVEILENIENDIVLNFIFQISIFSNNNKINEIVENVDLQFLSM